jgi:hypothetical protein
MALEEFYNGAAHMVCETAMMQMRIVQRIHNRPRYAVE